MNFKPMYILLIFLSAFFLQAGESGYVLQSGEELVDGRVILDENGAIEATVFQTRIPNNGKDYWYTDVGGPIGLGSRQIITKKEKPSWMEHLYDYYVIVNGEKNGPYDKVITGIDQILAPDNKHYGFIATWEKYFIPVVNGIARQNYPSHILFGRNYIPFSPSGNHSAFFINYNLMYKVDPQLYIDGEEYDGKWTKTDNFDIRVSDSGEVLFKDNRGRSRGTYLVTQKTEFAGPFRYLYEYGFSRYGKYALYQTSEGELWLKIGDWKKKLEGYHDGSMLVEDDNRFYAVLKDEQNPKGDRYSVSLLSVDLKMKDVSLKKGFFRTRKKQSVNDTRMPKDKALFLVENEKGQPLILNGDGFVLQIGPADYKIVDIFPEMGVLDGKVAVFRSQVAEKSSYGPKAYSLTRGLSSMVSAGTPMKKIIPDILYESFIKYDTTSGKLIIRGELYDSAKKKNTDSPTVIYLDRNRYTLPEPFSSAPVYGLSAGIREGLIYYAGPVMKQKYLIRRNNKTLEEIGWLDSKTFRVSPDASSWAMRFGKDKEAWKAQGYLDINGYNMGQFYGQPEWSGKERAFVALRARNNRVDAVAFKMAENGVEQHVVKTSTLTNKVITEPESKKIKAKASPGSSSGKSPDKKNNVPANALNLLSAYAKNRYRVSVHPASHLAYAWDVAGWSRENGGNIQLWNASEEMVQDFYFVKADKGENYYHIQSASSGLFLHISGAKDRRGSSILQWNGSGAPQTTFIAEADQGGRFSFRTLSGYYFDVAGGKPGAGIDIRLWEKNGSMAQKFVLRAEKSSVFANYIGKNNITIHPMANTRFVLQSRRGQNNNGVRFSLEYNRKGVKENNYRIFAAPPLYGNDDTYFIQNTATGRFLHTEGARFEDGTGVVLWEGCGGQNTRWSIEKQTDGSGFIIRSGGNTLLECNGTPPNNMRAGTGIGLHHDEGQADQRWTFRLMN